MTQYVPLGTVTAPADWTLPGGLEIQLETVFAHFNGASASGSFLPTLEIISDSGHTVVQIPMDASVASGSSVEATWAPFLGRGTAGAIRFDTSPQSGDYLVVDTTGSHGVTTTGILLEANNSSGAAVWIHAPSGGILLSSSKSIELSAGGDLQTDAAAGMVLTHPDSIVIQAAGQQIILDTNGVSSPPDQNGGLTVNDSTFVPVFEMRNDGSIHGRASVGAITWDL